MLLRVVSVNVCLSEVLFLESQGASVPYTRFSPVVPSRPALGGVKGKAKMFGLGEESSGQERETELEKKNYDERKIENN